MFSSVDSRTRQFYCANRPAGGIDWNLMPVGQEYTVRLMDQAGFTQPCAFNRPARAAAPRILGNIDGDTA
jgi:hypothetical protein